jgi:PIN domain nuclease of toxin-antitoxin system
MLEATGKIHLRMPCLDWVRKALETHGLVLVGVTPEIAIESSRLRGSFHGDPADRILRRLLGRRARV